MGNYAYKYIIKRTTIEIVHFRLGLTPESWIMIRHVLCILLLERSTTPQRPLVYINQSVSDHIENHEEEGRMKQQELYNSHICSIHKRYILSFGECHPIMCDNSIL